MNEEISTLIRLAGWPIEDTSTCHDGRPTGTDATEGPGVDASSPWRRANVTELYR